jgi:hypothetical protein
MLRPPFTQYGGKRQEKLREKLRGKLRERFFEDCPIVDNMPVKGGQIEVDRHRSSLTSRHAVSGTVPKTTPPATDPGTPAKPVPSPAPIDDDIDDGDIATPKPDRTGTDDEPL